MRTILLTAGLLFALAGTCAPLAGQDGGAPPDSAPESGWSPDPSHLFEAPTGRILERGELLVGVSSTSFSREAGEEHIPEVLAAYGLTSRVALRSAYRSTPARNIEAGRVLLGADLGLGSADAPLALRGEVELPLDNVHGRRMGNVTLLGTGALGTPERPLVLGLGWTGYRGLCRPEWEGCRSDWHGSTFALVGGSVPVGRFVQLVSENHVYSSSLSTTTGVRLGVGRLTAGAAFRGGVSGVLVGGTYSDGVLLSASYRVPVVRR